MIMLRIDADARSENSGICKGSRRPGMNQDCFSCAKVIPREPLMHDPKPKNPSVTNSDTTKANPFGGRNSVLKVASSPEAAHLADAEILKGSEHVAVATPFKTHFRPASRLLQMALSSPGNTANFRARHQPGRLILGAK